VKVEQNVVEPSELMDRLFLFAVTVVVTVRQTPDDEITAVLM